MKKNRCFKLTTLLLAMLMAFSSFSAFAEDGNNGADAQIGPIGVIVVEQMKLNDTFVTSSAIMDGDTKVEDLSAADPNHSFVLKLEISEPEQTDGEEKVELPADTGKVEMAYVLENVKIEPGKNEDVSWIYKDNKLVFKWVDGKKNSFRAEIPVAPNYPTDNDLSGTYILAITKNWMVTATPFKKDNRSRVRARELKKVNGKWTHEGVEDTAWTLTRVTGDWYTVSTGSQYMKLTQPNNLTLTGADEAQLIQIRKAKIVNSVQYYAFQADGLELNNPSHSLANGFASYAAGNPANAGDNNQFCLIPTQELRTEATADLSGSWVILNPSEANRTSVGMADSTTGRLKAITYDTLGNGYTFGSDPVFWTFEHITRDWYYVSTGGKYLNINDKGVELSENKMKLLVRTSDGFGTIVLVNGIDDTVYALTSKSNKAADGYGSTKYTVNDYTRMKLVTAEGVVDEDDGGTYLIFNVNGGNVKIAPNVGMVEEGQTVTIPDYYGTKNGKDFVGWAKVSYIYDKRPGTNNSYYEVYLPGTEYVVTAGKTILYAVFNEKGTNATFGFREDKTIPEEPGDYPTNLYKYVGHVDVKNTVKKGMWVVDIDPNKPVVGNHIENDVTANLSILPTDEQIKAGMPEYDPETMYVHWYVLKYAGKWKVDGVLRMRETGTISYSTNVDGENREGVQNMPFGHQIADGMVTVGASKDGTVTDPVMEGYEFLGWNTAADGSGTSYEPGAVIETNSNVTLFAQWDDILTVVIHSNVENLEKVYSGTEIVLTAERGGTYTGNVDIQWRQVDPETGEGTIIPGANEMTYSFKINKDNAKYRYQVILTPID